MLSTVARPVCIQSLGKKSHVETSNMSHEIGSQISNLLFHCKPPLQLLGPHLCATMSLSKLQTLKLSKLSCKLVQRILTHKRRDFDAVDRRRLVWGIRKVLDLVKSALEALQFHNQFSILGDRRCAKG